MAGRLLCDSTFQVKLNDLRIRFYSKIYIIYDFVFLSNYSLRRAR